MDNGVDCNDTEGELLTLRKGQVAIVDARLIHAGGPARTLTPLFNEKLGLPTLVCPEHCRALCPVRLGVTPGIRPYARCQASEIPSNRAIPTNVIPHRHLFHNTMRGVNTHD